jgi:NADPH-dependent 2,4-dienoyl-CoA reductase/sulfur reductase-like enzyme/rhodanese-related sulfurtransferase
MSQHDVVIVGASAAGLRCAARLRRLQPTWRVRVVDEQSTFSWAACGFPYALAGDVTDPQSLRSTADGVVRDADYFARVKGVDVLAPCRALEIDPRLKRLRVRGANGEEVLTWDDLVLATGARPRRLPGQPDSPRVTAFHTVHDLERIHAGLKGGAYRRVVIVGASFVGCELAEAFHALWGADVTLVEKAATPLASILDPEVAKIAAKVLCDNGVHLHTAATVDRIEADDHGVTVVTEAARFSGDLAVVALGVAPASELAARAGVALGSAGAIVVDDKLATSVPHIWAAGDCVQVRHAVTHEPAHLPLGSLANRQGHVLANVLAGRADRFGEVAGAMVIKIFDWTFAAVGITQTQAQLQGIDARSVWITTGDRAHYWPETKDLALQLVYEAGSHRLLGVQAAGMGEVAKPISVAAPLLVRGGTLEELSSVEHAYAPPYAPAVDPLVSAAFVALNQEDGVVAASPLVSMAKTKVLDVRHPAEREARPVSEAEVTALPLEDLRAQVEALRAHDWLVVCERGTRSAEAVRHLTAAQIRASYLGGGLRWREML